MDVRSASVTIGVIKNQLEDTMEVQINSMAAAWLD